MRCLISLIPMFIVSFIGHWIGKVPFLHWVYPTSIILSILFCVFVYFSGNSINKFTAEELEKLKDEEKSLGAINENLLSSIFNSRITDIVPETYITADALRNFYTYIRDNRCDTIRECINLYEQERKLDDIHYSVCSAIDNIGNRLESSVNDINKNMQKGLKSVSKKINAVSAQVDYIDNDVKDIRSDLDNQ